MALDHLPLQKLLVESVYTSFFPEDDMLAAVVLGSLASGKADSVSDADVIIFTQNKFHESASACYAKFEANREMFYWLEDSHNGNAFFKKYIFGDLT